MIFRFDHCFLGPVPLDFTASSIPSIDHWLVRFILEARRKTDGKPYPPNTLYGIITGIQRFYKDEKNRPDLDVLNSNNHGFIQTRKALDSRMKELTEQGYNVVRGSDNITPQDEAALWDSGTFNLNSARGLSYCVFFYNGKIFGLRGGSEHRSLTPDQFDIIQGSEGKFLRFTSRNTKNVSGGLKTRRVLPRVIDHYGEPDNERCVVRIFEKYLYHIPRNGSFYRKPLSNIDGMIIFSSQNIGENTLGKYVKTMFQHANIDTEGRKITNHSARHSLISSMLNAGHTDFDIKARSGHRSNALDTYKKPDINRKKNISYTLNPPSCTVSKPPPENPHTPPFNEPPMITSTPRRPFTRGRDVQLTPDFPVVAPTNHGSLIQPVQAETPKQTTIISTSNSGNDCMKIVVPECINKLIVYKGIRETVVILN